MTTKEELERAATRFETYIQADPANPMLWMELGEVQHRLGRFDAALASLEKALQLSPDLSAARSRMASVCISLHQFAQAEQELKALIEEGQQDPALQHNLGLALYFQERWEEARQQFEAAQGAGLRAPSNLAYLARALHHQGEMEQAIAACRLWAATDSSATSVGYLALLEMDNGNVEEARKLAARALQDDPENTDAALVIGAAAMEQQDADTASTYFESVLAKEPDSGRGWLGAGLARLYKQKHEEGIAALAKAQQFMPGNGGTIVALGWAKISRNDMTGAETSFREAIEADGAFAEAHGGLAVALLFQNKMEQAKKALEIATRLDKNNFGGLYARSIMLKLEGKGELATKLVARALDQPPPGGDKPLVEYIRTFAQQRRRPPQ